MIKAFEVKNFRNINGKMELGKYNVLISNELYKHVKSEYLTESTGGNIEMYAAPGKLSKRLETDIDNIAVNMELTDAFISQNRDKLCYRKERGKSQRMLKAVKPDIIAEMCSAYFSITYRQLKEL